VPYLVDSCVFLDVFIRDPYWYEWSAGMLTRITASSDIIINPIIYAEISVRFDTVEELDQQLNQSFVGFRGIPKEAAFLAGKCYLDYRRRSGTRTSPLPDFFIGAHAAVEGLPLVTRDLRRYGEYFPKLEMICP